MPEFSAKADCMAELADVLWTQQDRLEEASGEAMDICGRLAGLSRMEEVIRRLKRDSAALQRQSDSLAAMTRTLDTAAELYRSTEQTIRQRQILGSLTAVRLLPGPGISVPRTEPRPPWTEILWWVPPLEGAPAPQISAAVRQMLPADVMRLFRKG